MDVPTTLFKELRTIGRRREALLDEHPLPPEAAAKIDAMIVRLSYQQDWCGPNAAVLEGHWRGLLTENYWLHRIGEIEVPLDDVLEAALPVAALSAGDPEAATEPLSLPAPS